MSYRRRGVKMQGRIPKPPINTTIRHDNHAFLLQLIKDKRCSHLAVAVDWVIDQVRRVETGDAIVLEITPPLQRVIDDYYKRHGAGASEEPDEIIANYALKYFEAQDSLEE